MRHDLAADLVLKSGHVRPDDLLLLVREIQVTESHSFRVRSRDQIRCPQRFRSFIGVRIRATIRTATDAPTITRPMLDLCSAPCKARRFAPPAHARGLRALTTPARRSCLGNYVMAGGVMTLSWTDLDR